MKFKLNDQVEIKSFWGTKEANEKIAEEENYWKLIGKKGKIIKIRNSPHPAFPDKGNQIMVQFSENINKLGLEAHNEEENSLWFFHDDIRKIEN